MRIWILVGLLSFFSHTALGNYDRLKFLAEEALKANTFHLSSGPYLVAGRHQYKTLWTRDFCHGARGLLVMGEFETVRNHLNAVLRFRREDGLVARVLDNMDPKFRAVHYIMAKAFYPYLFPDLPLKDPLKPEYVDQFDSFPVDSNFLVLQTALDYVAASGDQNWWRFVEPALVEVFRFYDDHFENDLIKQPAYSDVHDSVRRDGHAFYANMHYYVTAQRLQKFGAFGVDSRKLEAMRARIMSVFFDENTGLFRTIEGHDYYGLPGNLQAIEMGFVVGEEAKSLFKALKASEFWTRNNHFPGFNTFPNYPKEWRHDYVKLVGLDHYHDSIYWPWLVALSAKVSFMMNDREGGHYILNQLQYYADRDGTLFEIWEDKAPFKPWNSLLFKSEHPFSWSAGFTLDALRALEK